MQGKGVVKFFAVLLGVVCLYMLSFTWVVQKVKNDAKTYAKGDTTKYKAYIDSMSNRPVYPVFGHTLQYCLSHELALGLDLQGGMSVTMQVSLVELVKTLSNNNPDVVFNQALKQADMEDREGKSQSDYITLFVNDYEKLNPNGKLAAIFANKDNQADLKFNDDNAKVEAYLKKQADVAVQNTYTVINTRIDQFGVTQPNVVAERQKPDPDRITRRYRAGARAQTVTRYRRAGVLQHF
jgi:SecD/SecF fusion protein